jgi:tetratricopeptide (TPR) repeat protein
LPTAERFDAALYLLLGGIFAAGAVWLHRRLPPTPNWLGPAVAVICVIGLGILSVVQLPAFRDAPSLWAHVLKHNPNSLVALNEMGTFELNEAKSPQRAIGQFARAVSVDPTDWRTLFNLGRAHAAAGEYDRAIMRYQEILSRRPDDVDVRFQLAIAYASQHRRVDAVREMEQVIRARPGFAEAYVHLGTFHADLGNFKPAADAMKEAVRLDPRDPTAYIMLAWLAYTQFNDPTTAEGLLVQARKLDLRKPETVLLAGDILFELSKQETDPQKRENMFQTTVYYYREGVRLLPDSASPYKRLGIALGALSQTMGQPDQAVDCLNEAIICFERATLLDRDDPEATRFREDAVRQRDALVRKIR